MEAIARILAGIVTVPIFVPFVVFILVYFYSGWKRKTKRDAVTMAVNITTFFLITAVIMMYGLIKDEGSASAFWWVLLFFLIIGGALAFLQVKVRGQIDLPKVFRASWRLAFLFFTVAYVVLLFSGVSYFLQHT